MKKIKYIIKLFLFLVILFALAGPQLQKFFKVIGPRPLDGFSEYVGDTEFDFFYWFYGSYQKHKEIYSDQNYGLRDYIIRIHNELAFRLWKQTNATAMVIGKKNYLYEKAYIEAVTGEDYIGEDSIALTTRKLIMIKDTLRRLNVKLLVVLTPGKGNFYAEYIPRKFFRDSTQTNYEQYKEIFEKKKLDYIDFNDWFLKNKNSATYPLYPQYGLHWSMYGAWLAADSLLKKMQALYNVQVPSYKCTFIDYPASARNDDYDAANVLNLWIDLPTYKMAYPFIMVEKDTIKNKAAVMVIADSYYWQIKHTGIPDKAFNSTFWFYNRPDMGDKSKPLKDKELKNAIESQDIIIILSNPPNLRYLGWGFIENAYELYYGKDNR